VIDNKNNNGESPTANPEVVLQVGDLLLNKQEQALFIITYMNLTSVDLEPINFSGNTQSRNIPSMNYWIKKGDLIHIPRSS
jgi:hypothetical protein